MVARLKDFVSPDGKVAPSGMYDLQKNEAWVSVGISHDTAEFAVETVRTWWTEMGASAYPDATSLVITADGGGSNSYRLRSWKLELVEQRALRSCRCSPVCRRQSSLLGSGRRRPPASLKRTDQLLTGADRLCVP